MTSKKTGVPLVISAPSGTGKSTLIARLLKEFPSFTFSISYTTRAPRKGEINGKDYHFVEKSEFLRLRDANFFAEWAEVHDHFYGTPLQATRDLLTEGRDIIFDIDVQGARQLKATLPQACFLFLFPPSFAALQSRLRRRDTDTAEVIAKRLNNAAREIRQSDLFDFWIINDDLEKAYQELRCVYLAAGTQAVRYPEFRESLIRTRTF